MRCHRTNRSHRILPLVLVDRLHLQFPMAPVGPRHLTSQLHQSTQLDPLVLADRLVPRVQWHPLIQLVRLALVVRSVQRDLAGRLHQLLQSDQLVLADRLRQKARLRQSTQWVPLVLVVRWAPSCPLAPVGPMVLYHRLRLLVPLVLVVRLNLGHQSNLVAQEFDCCRSSCRGNVSMMNSRRRCSVFAVRIVRLRRSSQRRGATREAVAGS